MIPIPVISLFNGFSKRPVLLESLRPGVESEAEDSEHGEKRDAQ